MSRSLSVLLVLAGAAMSAFAASSSPAPPVTRSIDGVRATRVGAVPASTPVRFYVVFRSSAPSAGDVSRFLGHFNMQPHWKAGDVLMTVDATAGGVDDAFHTTLGDYTTPRGVRFHAPDGALTLAPSMKDVVVGGLDTYPQIKRHARTSALYQATPDDVLGLYDIKPLRDRGLDGSGEVIILPEIDGPPAQSDLDQFASQFGLASFDSSNLVIKTDDAWGTPDPQLGAGEATLDVEVAHAIAPKAKLVLYETSGRVGETLEALQQAIRDYPTAIVSESLGACEMSIGDFAETAQAELAADLNAHGGSWFVASGDQGAYGCAAEGDDTIREILSTDAFASPAEVTAVGGTSAFVGSGHTYFKEGAWGEPIEWWGSGGGVSAITSQPSWQKGPGVDNQYSAGMRQVPDVAGLADPLTAGWAIVEGGETHPVGGTSAAAPLWAAMVTLINQDLSAKHLRRVGFANPALYYFGQNAAQLPSPPYHDVTVGNNLYYPATKGWDYATGWGSPIASGLADDWETYMTAGGS